MKLYLNDKERSLEFLNLIDVMLKNGVDNGSLSLPKVSDIYQVDGVEDPVKEFLEYYIVDSNLSQEFDNGRINWVLNALYSVKGAPQIFDIFQEAFNIKIEYKYEFPVIDILNFGKLVVTDVVLFINKFKNMIYHLLYYTEMKLAIEDLIINVSSLLNQYNTVVTKGFITHEVVLSNNVI